MAKCVEKLNRLKSTIKAQKYYCNYKLGKTIVFNVNRAPCIEAFTKTVILLCLRDTVANVNED